MSEQTSLTFYSIGIVAQNKARNSDWIKVTPIERISSVDGSAESVSFKPGEAVKYDKKNNNPSLLSQTTTYDVTSKDHRQVQSNDVLTSDTVIDAKWLPFGQSNRVTSPDVIAGETVMIMQSADTDQYFWFTIMREPIVRRQETVCYMFGNIPTGIKGYDKASSYWMEVSTHDKYMHVHTSKNDGEPYSYDMKIDTASGSFTLTDDVGNSIVLDSAQNKITFTTLDTIEAKAPKVVVNAETSVTVTSPMSTFNGDVTVTGNTALQGGLSVGGAAQVSGAITGDSSITGKTVLGTDGVQGPDQLW